MQNNVTLEITELKQIAQAAATRAHAPYSRFPVGAVLLFKDGSVVTGCNVENASYGLTNCAERTAIFSAQAQGYDLKDVVSVCIYTPSEVVYSPCGACRQVLAEFIAPQTPVISTAKVGEKVWSLEQLLPDAFQTFEPTLK
ncbi:cytidine deaminase [Pseudidiomarina taiwanensis]|uniref:Cytidine deaminase n=1 Tax=Pseudidiomarina taiwanensis TaxID=337250 RepID=A0A432ZC59_9GAMM|nr:cytidine deaminase [Pseudidiomarina taiwanensis]RUO75553.1 cytidine deaminase [Pseudidiomarina taiwanensis]